jgi:hypothetical protein
VNLKKFVMGDYVEPGEEGEVERLAIIGVLELGADIEENRLRAKLNRDYVRFVNPGILDRLDSFILRIGKFFFKK